MYTGSGVLDSTPLKRLFGDEDRRIGMGLEKTTEITQDDMYRLVNENAQKILTALKNDNDVEKYLSTLEIDKLNDNNDAVQYKKNYITFYKIRGLSNELFLDPHYFEILKTKKINNNDNIKSNVDSLFTLLAYFESIACNEKKQKKCTFLLQQNYFILYMLTFRFMTVILRVFIFLK